MPLLATALIAVAGLAHAADELVLGGSVDNLLAFAREHHPALHVQRHAAAAAAERIESAGALPDPMFGIELRDFTDASNNNSGASVDLLPPRIRGAARYTATQSLPWFGKRDLRRAVAAAESDAAAHAVAAGWDDLAWQIKQTFAEHYLHGTSLRYGRENLVLLEQLAGIAEVRYANGLAPQQDVIRAQTERTALASELAMLEGDSARSSARMKSLLGRPAGLRLKPPERLRELPAQLDVTALDARLLARNPRLATDTARIAAAEKGRELTWRERYPDVNVGLAGTQQRNMPNSYDLMFEINIPLQQGARRAREREAERTLDAARARREATQIEEQSAIAENLAALQAARRIEELVSASLLPQAELTLQSALAGYETGKVDFAAVLDAQRQIRKAKEDLVRARVLQELRRADIERAIGEEL